jgi:hypothetical protein
VKRILLVSAILLGACAAAPEYEEADEQALSPVRETYQQCIASETKEVINGSDDVNFLVQHVVQHCEPQLRPLEAYLKERGFSSPFIQNFLTNARDQATQVTGSFILRAKGGGRGS